MKQEFPTYQNIIFYDGVCLLCNRFIRFVLRSDRKKQLYIAPLQSSYAKETLAVHQINSEKLKSVVFKKGDQLYSESEAVVRIYQSLGFPWSVMIIFLLVPSFIRDGIYRWIARNRYQWFGKSDQVCDIQGPDFRNRIIDFGSVR